MSGFTWPNPVALRNSCAHVDATKPNCLFARDFTGHDRWKETVPTVTYASISVGIRTSTPQF
ncbi:hypothetical protein DPMN_176239 [Dreissena polymorpha]|uniref:Uncharacterized protein n=1 Tax=Dreissena polymorpha TaxID=45954 RepID=A0A9D4IGR1_DREPO|nr:hypothetical protein DPMN_176239 [Dreissena polymorpha]